MTRFLTMVLPVLLLGGLCPAGVEAQKDGPGTLIPEVTVRSDPDLSYALYLPPEHALDQRWLVLVLMDPRGRARVPLDLFVPAARDLGFVILSSYDTSSDEPDSAVKTDRAVEGMLNDALNDLSLDPRRIYLVGFSGTARRAWLIGLQVPELVAGVGVFGAGALPSNLLSLAAEHYRAWRAYRRAADTYPEPADALAGLDRLASTDEVRETREAVGEWLGWEQESEERIARGLRLLDEDRLPPLGELVSQTGLRELHRQLESRDTLAARAADRQVAALAVTAGFYLPRSYLEAGEVERAVRSLELAYTARPEAASRICSFFDEVPGEQRPNDTPLARVCERGAGESPQRSVRRRSGLSRG